ncbi:MAG TPA: ribonuclease E/G [Caulobacteraceae bacterium]
MTGRRLYLDEGPGEARGVVTLDGRPERLLIEREGAPIGPRIGERHRARVEEVSPGLSLARLALGEGQAAVLPLSKQVQPHRGAAIEVEIAAEPRADKAAVARLIGAASGPPQRLRDAPGLQARLNALAPGAAIIRGDDARGMADEAEDAALAIDHPLAGGITLYVEPTRALIAVDIDWSGPARPSAAAVMRANLEALAETARVLRLKAIGGAVGIDLIGFPRDREAIQAAARDAFAPDQPGVVVLPVNRFGLLQLAKPHRERPLREVLCAEDGRLSARSVAQRLARALERRGRDDPGGRFAAECAPAVAAALEPLILRLGPRFQAREVLGWDRLKTDIQDL